MTSPDDPLPVTRAAELEQADRAQAWLIDPLWARAAVGMIGGAPKCCKSWLGLDLALSVATGSPCLGRFHVALPGNVLIYMAEDSTAIVRARLAGLCRHRELDLRGVPIDVITAPSLRLDLDRDQHRLAETVRRHRPRLLLLDPFVRLHRIDENHAGDVSAILAYLRALQREHDVAIVVAHHAKKNAAPSTAPGQGLRGSGDFHAWGDSNLYLRRLRGQLLLTVEHRAAPASDDPLHLSLVSDDADAAHLEVSGSQRSPDPHEDLDSAVLQTITDAGPIPRDALRAALRVRNERLGNALRRLVAAGRVHQLGDCWTLASPVRSHDTL